MIKNGGDSIRVRRLTLLFDAVRVFLPNYTC